MKTFNNRRSFLHSLLILPIAGLFAFTYVAVAAGTLSNFSFTYTNNEVGEYSDYTLQYEVETAAPDVIMRIVEDISSDFDFSSSTAEIAVDGATTTINEYYSGANPYLILDIPLVVATGSEVTIILRDVKNPTTEGTHSFELYTSDFASTPIDTTTDPTITIVPASTSTTLAGSGTSGDPWQISTCAELQSLNDDYNNYNDHFILTDNIDCSNINPFLTIDFGDDEYFQGTFDGNGHTISNLNIVQNEDYNAGLFYGLSATTVENLHLSNANVSGSFEAYAGILAGSVYNSDIQQVHVSGAISTSVTSSCSYIGGMFGFSLDNLFTDVLSEVSIDLPTCTGVGGLIGYSGGDTINNASTLGDVKGEKFVGGLIGYSGNTIISTASAEVNPIYGDNNVGGFMGSYTLSSATNVNLSDLSAINNVTGVAKVGGLIGSVYVENGNTLNLIRSYSVGDVTTTNLAGGLVGDTLVDDGSLYINSTYAWGEVSGTVGSLGGLIGNMKVTQAGDSISVNDSYAWYDGTSGISNLGSVSNAGGLIGYIVAPTNGGMYIVQNSFADTPIANTISHRGGLVGLNEADVDDVDFVNNWFNNEHIISGELDCDHDDTLECNKADDSAHFMNNKINHPLDSWDFDTTWKYQADAPPVFGINPIDTTPPAIVSLIPDDNATNVSVSTNELSIYFDEYVYPGNGNIVLKKQSDNSVVFTADVTDVDAVLFSGDTVTVLLSSFTFEAGIAYYVQFPAGAIKDVDDNDHPGINDATGWNFTTEVEEVIITPPNNPNPPVSGGALIWTVPPLLQ